MCFFGVFRRKILLLVILGSALCLNALAIPTVSAKSAIVIDASTNQPVWEQNAHDRCGMASTTKIMTALLAIEYGDLDKEYTVPNEAIGIEGSSLYLKSGEIFSLRELVIGLMLQSANDAGVAISIIVSGSTKRFVDLMNQKATEIGLHNTHFCNPHGLSDENHYTTAYELALLTSYALKNNTFREICALRSSTISSQLMSRTVQNHNKLLSLYEGTIGVKTGFTKATGRCLVSAAVRNGVELVAVTLNAPDDWNDHKALLDHGFSSIERVSLVSEGDIIAKLPILNGKESDIAIYAQNDASVILAKNHGSIVQRIELNRPRFAPVYKGDAVGRIVFCCDGAEIASVPLCAADYVATK